MTLADITARITFLTNASTTDYSAANRLISLNKWYNFVHTWILESHDEIDFDDSNKTDLPILTTDLTANTQTVALPSGTCTAKRLEVNYGNKWYKAEPFDINERGAATDTTSISQNFNVTEPRYDLAGSTIFLYPIPTQNVTGGLRIWINRFVTEFTSSDVSTGTKLPGFDVNFHDILPLGVAFDWAVAKGQTNKADLWAQIQDYEARLKRHYGKKQEDRIMRLAGAYQNME